MQAYAIDADSPPKPGHPEAIKLGCTCAKMDNHNGLGRGGDGGRFGWYITGGCPVHDAEDYCPGCGELSAWGKDLCPECLAVGEAKE